jgi:Leucine-rich repeat (LRR) protein
MAWDSYGLFWRRKNLRLWVHFCILAIACGLTLGGEPQRPELDIRPSPSNPDGGMLVDLRAAQGHYALQTSANLGDSWRDWTNVFLIGTGVLSNTMEVPQIDALYFRAERVDWTNAILFQTAGASFEVELECEIESDPRVVWDWSDGTSGTDYPLASKVFEPGLWPFQRLSVVPSESLTKVNVGFNAGSGGDATDLGVLESQQVTAIIFPQPLLGLRVWASADNPITNTLDFSGFLSLETIESGGCSNLVDVVTTNLPALRRVCFEGCGLQVLDLSGCPELEDVRAGGNDLTNVVVGSETGPRIWHWSTYDNPGLSARLLPLMTNFRSLREVWIWNNNQAGDLGFVSTNLSSVRAHDNFYDFADLSGQSNLQVCDLSNNLLTNIVLTGCVALEELNLRGNRLTAQALDTLLAELDASMPHLVWVDLSGNAEPPSAFGQLHYANLVSRGIRVTMDWEKTEQVILQTTGSIFEPEVYCDEEISPFVEWIWGDGSQSTDYPIAYKDFGFDQSRYQVLTVDGGGRLTRINVGFDGADGGELTPLPHRPPQQVRSVVFPKPLPHLQVWASSYNPITNTLDFRGFDQLEYLEAFRCQELREVIVTNLPSLRRLCLEACDLEELDLSGNPNLEDVRAAVNDLTNVVVGAGTGPKVWHWCLRDNPRMEPRFHDLLTDFHSLMEFWVWNANQDGHLSLVSTNLTSVRAYRNRYTSADLSGHAGLRSLRLYENQLTNVVLTGCIGLEEVDLHANLLTSEEMDHLLQEMDLTAPELEFLDLTGNTGLPTEAGLVHYTNLLARGVKVFLDLPDENDGRLNVAGGDNAITFVTTRQTPGLEIRTEGVLDSIAWHWGDGTITRNLHVASHRFEAEGVYTNYVEVIPPGAVTYFGAPRDAPGQGIQALYGASNLPNLDYLFLFSEELTELSIAGCGKLRQLHLAETMVSTEVCDQWFFDLDQAVTEPVLGADFWYPADRRSAVSDPAWWSLIEKGFQMKPY